MPWVAQDGGEADEAQEAGKRPISSLIRQEGRSTRPGSRSSSRPKRAGFAAHGEITPDYIWREKAWDLKTVTTEKSADSAIRHGLKQIWEKPGGIFLDYRGKEIDMAALELVINSRMRHSKIKSVDIMVVLDDNTVIVFRYKK